MKRLGLLVVLGLALIVVPPVAVWCCTHCYDFSQQAARTSGSWMAEAEKSPEVMVVPNWASEVAITHVKPGTLTLTDPNGLTDASIRLLCRSGRVCAVMGHQWKRFVKDDGDSQWFRQCGLCDVKEPSKN